MIVEPPVEEQAYNVRIDAKLEQTAKCERATESSRVELAKKIQRLISAFNVGNYASMKEHAGKIAEFVDT